VRYRAKFRGDQSNYCWDIAVYWFFRDGGYPQSWICCTGTRVWITHKQYLVVFIVVQNLVGFGAVVSIICQFLCFASLAWKCLFTSPLGGFGEIWLSKWNIISKNVRRVKYADHNGSNGALTMPVYVYVPEKLHEQKMWRRRSRRRRKKIYIICLAFSASY